MSGNTGGPEATAVSQQPARPQDRWWKRLMTGALAVIISGGLGTLGGVIVFLVEARWGWREELILIGLGGGAFLGLLVVLGAWLARTVTKPPAKLALPVGIAAILTILLMNPYTFRPFGWTALASIPLFWAAWVAAGATQDWRLAGVLTLVLGLVGGLLTVAAGYVVQSGETDAFLWALAGVCVFFIPATLHLRPALAARSGGPGGAHITRALVGLAVTAAIMAAVSAVSWLLWPLWL